MENFSNLTSEIFLRNLIYWQCFFVVMKLERHVYKKSSDDHFEPNLDVYLKPFQ